MNKTIAPAAIERGKMKIKAILPYFGGKRNLAAKIVDVLGPHRSYWEPFCGSMAVLFAKQPCEMETVNDLNGDLINLAKVIQHKELGFELYEKLARTLYAEDFFREAKERWISNPKNIHCDPDISRAYDFFVASWMGINGVSGTARYNYQFAVRWCRGGGQGATRWQSVVNSIPAWHKRLQGIVIMRRDAFEVIDNIKDESNVAVYCDPPYLNKGTKYVHDFKAGDHERLAESLKRFKKAKVVVSYYDDPRLDILYEGFNKIAIDKSRQSLANAMRGPKKKTSKKQVEVLLVNSKSDGLFE